MADLLKDQNDLVWISVPLDAKTAARLQNLSNFCREEPISVAASLLHDILKDDEEAHRPPSAAGGGSFALN